MTRGEGGNDERGGGNPEGRGWVRACGLVVGADHFLIVWQKEKRLDSRLKLRE